MNTREIQYKGNSNDVFMAPELLPCPFCGGKPHLFFIGNQWTESRKVRIKCSTCRIERVDAARANNHEWVANVCIKHWNDRQLPSSNEAMVPQSATYDDVTAIIMKRVTDTFSDGFHNHERNMLLGALSVIQELVPPSCFAPQSEVDNGTVFTITHPPGLGWIIPNASTTRFYLPCMSNKIDGMKWYASKDEAFAKADKYNNRQLEYDESESSPGKATQSGEAMEVLRDVTNDLVAALEWIDNVPKDISLPVMPGFDRDVVDNDVNRARHLLSSPTSENKETTKEK